MDKSNACHHLDALSGALATAMVSVVTVAQAKVNPDMVAVLGAMLAAVISVIDARKKDRTTGHTISVLIASAFAGSVIPGAAMWFFFPEKVTTLSWHAWAALGFVVGLLGWAFTIGVLAVRSRIPWLVSNAADKLGVPPTPPTCENPPPKNVNAPEGPPPSH